jgi:putative transposase
MKSIEKKQLFLDSLKAGFHKYDYMLYAWVILDEHYHIEFEAQDSKMLSKIMNQLHGSLSYLFNMMDSTKGRKIFQNYWDTCVREEKDLWRRFNYIHHNPVKHGYCQNMEDFTFSSFTYYLKERGKAWLDDCFSTYPIVDFTLKEEDTA